jgi:hypothetical protein
MGQYQGVQNLAGWFGKGILPGLAAEFGKVGGQSGAVGGIEPAGPDRLAAIAACCGGSRRSKDKKNGKRNEQGSENGHGLFPGEEACSAAVFFWVLEQKNRKITLILHKKNYTALRGKSERKYGRNPADRP